MPTQARLYDCSPADLQGVLPGLTDAWTVQDETGAALGALTLRPSPAHGAELFGGAFPGPEQSQAARLLTEAAHAAQPRLYAFAEAHLLPLEVLVSAGWREAGVYTRLTGMLARLTDARPEPPTGCVLRPFAEVGLAGQLKGMQTYEDRIGHHGATEENVQDGAGGADLSLSLVAFDEAGQVVGLCSVSVEGDAAQIGSPGVAMQMRHTGLRRALLLGVLQGLRQVGEIETVQVEGWGDTPEELVQDTELGLSVTERSPIMAAP